MHLAQLNIGRLAYAKDDPRVAEFMDNLELVTGIAERSPGFVWRMQDEAGDATNIAVPWALDDPRSMANMSVWESVEALEHFVWNTVHKRFYEKKFSWFEAMDEAHMVLWWVAEGHRPDLHEAMARLEHLRAHGDDDQAFGWAYLQDATRWRDGRCTLQAAE